MRSVRATIGTKSQGACSINDSLVSASMQSLVLITKWGPIKGIIDIGQDTATFNRRPNKLGKARLEWMIQQVILNLEIFKMCKKVAISVGLKDLVVANLTLLVLACNTNFSSGNGLGSSQRPASIVVTALTVDHGFHYHLCFLLCWGIVTCFCGREYH